MADISKLASAWTGLEILPHGITGVERDTGKVKLGDGRTPWQNLDYLSGAFTTTYDDTPVVITAATAGTLLQNAVVRAATRAGGMVGHVSIAGGVLTVQASWTLTATGATGDILLNLITGYPLTTTLGTLAVVSTSGLVLGPWYGLINGVAAGGLILANGTAGQGLVRTATGAALTTALAISDVINANLTLRTTVS